MIELKEYNFSDLYEMSSGISSTKEQAGHGAPFASFSVVFNNIILPDELTDYMDTSVKEQETYSIKKGDILITRTSETLDELAMSSVALKDYPNATYSGFVKRLRPLQKDVTYDKFMAFYLRSPYFRKIIQNNTNMTLRASFNEDIFSYIKILLPDYSTQKKLGDALYLLQKKIDNNNLLIGKMMEKAKLLYNYWFLQYEFPNEEGKAYKSSGGSLIWNKDLHMKIPNGWKVKKYEKCIEKISTGLNPRDNFVLGGGNIKYITVKNLRTDGTIDFDKCDTVNEQAREIIHNRSDIAVGDILFASIAPLGRCYLIQDMPKDWDINESVFSIRPNYNEVSSIYLYMNFVDENFVRRAFSNSTGSIFKGIRIGSLQNMYLLVPPKPIVDAFTDKLKDSFLLMNKREQENNRLIELREFILPMLINGQVILDK